MVVMYCAELDVDLDLSMYVSFLLPLFRRRGDGSWVKVYGAERGVVVHAEKGRICCEGCSTRLFYYLSGLWCIERCRRRLRVTSVKLPEPITSIAWRLTLPASPYDADLIAIAAFLSRRTSWVANTVKWVASIAEKGVGVDSVRETAAIYRSYQLYQLLEVIDDLLEAVAPIKTGRRVDATTLRQHLLSVKHVGPKVADSIILFTGVSSSVAPYDTHLRKLLQELGFSVKSPTKELCLRFTCSLCPRSRSCAVALLLSMFGEAAGLVQSAAYAYYSLGGSLERLPKIVEKLTI